MNKAYSDLLDTGIIEEEISKGANYECCILSRTDIASILNEDDRYYQNKEIANHILHEIVKGRGCKD